MSSSGVDRRPDLPDLESDDNEAAPPPKPWSRRRQDLAVLIWASFLTAAAGTMLFFAFVDPAEMLMAISPDVDGSRMTGYGYGFFFFWLLTMSAAALVIYLVRTARRASDEEKMGSDGSDDS